MKPRGLDHIGIAVRSLEKAVRVYSLAFGVKFSAPSKAADFGVKIAKGDLAGDTIELLEPMSSDSTVGRFLKKRGEGIHHIAVAVGDIEKALDDLRRAGVRLIDERPRIGASGRKVAFVSPRSSHGVLIELCEAKK